MSRGTYVDMTGRRFGKLVVLFRVTSLNGSRQSRWHCLCDCKNETDVRGTHLTGKNIVSCGCYNLAIKIKHGHVRGGRWSGSYVTWASMIQRCVDPSSTSYPRYGGRGIMVCERWRTFENFLADMGERPPGMSIERSRNDGNYEPDNCSWLPRRLQNRNRSVTRLTVDAVQEIHGRCEYGESQRSVARRLGISESLLSQVRRGVIWSDQVGGPL